MMMMTKSLPPSLRTLAVAAAFALAGAAAQANTLSYTITAGNVTAPTVYGSTGLGTLSPLPVTVNFGDQLTPNTGSSPLQTTDNWTFSIAAANLGGSVTGEQISLQDFAVSGVVDSVTLYNTASNQVVTSGVPVGSFTDAVLATLGAGSYELQVVATLGGGTPSAPTAGSYTGTLVATAAVPEPSRAAMMLSGVLVLMGIATLRTRRQP